MIAATRLRPESARVWGESRLSIRRRLYFNANRENHPMQNHVQSPTEVTSSFVLANPECPVCKTGMRLVHVTPVIFAHDLNNVSYVCDECGMRTKRTLKRL